MLVWAKAHELTLAIYKATERFPRSEVYGLTSQVRRASYSIPMNIAEGCGKSTDADFARFLDMAAGSASELDYQFLLSRDLGFMSTDEHDRLAKELADVRKMLTALIRTVRRTKAASSD